MSWHNYCKRTVSSGCQPLH